MKPKALGVATILGLLGTAIGIVVPIVWDQYKTKTALDLRQLSNSVVVSRSQDIEKLQFLYAGTPVPSLSRIELELKNTGRTPIRQADVVTPVVIHVRDAPILDARISRVSPANLDVSQELSVIQDAVTLRFPLLNPNDAAYVTLLVATDHAEVSASTRIAGLDNLTFSISPTNLGSRREERGWPFYIVVAMSIFAILIFLLSLYMNGAESTIAKLVRAQVLTLPTFPMATEYISWFKQLFYPPKSSTELKPLERWIATLPQDVPLSIDQRLALHDQIRNALTNTSAALGAMILFGILALIGTAYVIYRIW